MTSKRKPKQIHKKEEVKESKPNNRKGLKQTGNGSSGTGRVSTNRHGQ